MAAGARKPENRRQTTEGGPRTYFSFAIRALSSVLCLLLFSCAPVLRKDIMDQAVRNVSLSDIKRKPEVYKGKLFVFGGVIVNTRVTAEGSLIEALYATVDSRGYLKTVRQSEGRFLALFPKENGILDPVIFRKGREVTIAAELAGTREGKMDEMVYVYPFFRIRELYLWEERSEYNYPPYYYYDPFYYDPFYYDRPFFRHRFFRHHP